MGGTVSIVLMALIVLVVVADLCSNRGRWS
jgi:hypothetical protein